MQTLRTMLAIGLLSCFSAVTMGAPVRAEDTQLVRQTFADSNHDDTQLVRQTFADYKSAVLTNDGEHAASLLNQATVEYYGDIHQLALCGSAQEVKAQSLLNRMMVVFFRFSVPNELLTNMSGHAALVYAVEQGWIGKDSVMRSELGEVEISSQGAVAQLLRDGEPSGTNFHFSKESDGWKFNLLPIIKASNSMMAQLAKRLETEENDFLIQLAASVAGYEPSEEVWEPVSPESAICRDWEVTVFS